MSLGKRISAWYNLLLCFVFGHTLTNICQRCGKVVNLKGTKRLTIEERINGYFRNRKELKKTKTEFKGSLKLKTGLKKYSINLKTNELRLVDYEVEFELDKDGNPTDKVKKRNAQFDPFAVYIDASNDDNAIRKANNYLFGVKQGVTITYVTPNP